MKESIHKEYSTIRKITNLYLYPIIKYIRLERSLLCHNNKSLLKSKRTKFTLYTYESYILIHTIYQILFIISHNEDRYDSLFSLSAGQGVSWKIFSFGKRNRSTISPRLLLAGKETE